LDAEDFVGGGATGSGLGPSSFTALLEITNLRRTGGPFNLGVFGLLLRLVCGMFFAAVALRFNIIIRQMNRLLVQKFNKPHTANARLLTQQTRSWLMKLELRTPED
jgi:hypothetical protein